MTKHKNFHGPGGKGGLMRQRAFYCKKHPFDVMAQPLPRQKKIAPGAANAQGGKKAPQATNLNKAAPIVQGGERDCQDER